MVRKEEPDSFEVPASAGSAEGSKGDVAPGAVDFPGRVLFELSLSSERTIVGAILH